MENPISMDDLGVPLFLETTIYQYCCIFFDVVPAAGNFVTRIMKIVERS